MLMRSVSEPSIGTAGNVTIGTNATERNSHVTTTQMKLRLQSLRGRFFWEGRMRRITTAFMMTPWNMWFQFLVHVTIVYNYILHLLLAYYLDEKWLILDSTIFIGELFFLFDVLVHVLHSFWALCRLHIRVKQRNHILLMYDVMSLLPLWILFYKNVHSAIILTGRWLAISRVYRLNTYFGQVNESFQTSRKVVYILEHLLSVVLLLHGSTCLWYGFHQIHHLEQSWYSLGFPPQVNSRKMKFDNYLSCWYYCASRVFNVIFGDVFPLRFTEKLLTVLLMLVGYVFIRFQFIGLITWELVLEGSRRYAFVERYHHMIKYLKFHGAPSWLIKQAAKYKKQLWIMKDGVLTSNHLKMLPLSLQMEMIFDINVADFHNSLLFQKTDENFMRQISLLMRHEIFLEGQHIWSQGVVKNGMLCVKRGVIEMLSDEDDESPMISFKAGTVLGELSLFYSIPSKVTVKAATYVELQVLRRTDFMRVVAEHPAMLQQIRETIYDRLCSTIKKQKAITRYDKGDSRLIRTRYRPMKVLKDNLAGVEEEDPTFVDDSHMYYKDENNVRKPKFTTEYLKLYQLSSNVTTIDGPRICLRATFPWILEPNTSFTHMFDVSHFIVVVYLCIMSPHYAIQFELSELEIIFTTIVFSGMLLNIYLQLTTAVVDKNVKKVTVKEIAEVKMASIGFYLDILSVFPMYIFTDTLDPHSESISGQIVKLLPVLQVWHIWDYLDKWSKNFDSNLKLLSLLKYCLLVMIFCYWTGCFLYLFACPRKLCFENSWMSQLIYWETKLFMTNVARHEQPLLSSLSFGTSVLTGSGTSSISPGSTELFVVPVLFILGTYIHCMYTSKICSLFILGNQRKLKFKESMRELFYFLSVNHVSSKIKSRVKKFFCVQWYYNNAVSSRELFQDMSTNIQQEVLSLEMVETLLHCPIFQSCNKDFLQTVAANSRTIVLPDNETVQHAGDIRRDMYIVQKGHCNLLNHLAKVVKFVRPGDYFGVVEMLYGLPKVYTALTSTNCILLHIEYSALVQCWGTFPDISHPIMKVLEDQEIKTMAKHYENAKPLTGKIGSKTNRIAQEIKESFVVITGRDKVDYAKAFDKLGVTRYIRHIFLPGCITPHGMFLKCWCALRFLLAIYYILIIPYNYATRQHKFMKIYNWEDILLYVDIIVMAYVAYYNEKSLLVTHPLLTVSRYLKRSFLLDIISVFPFEQVLRIVNDNTDMDLYRINRLLLVTRITGAFRYWESDIMNVNPVIVLLKFLPIAVTVVNFATALIFTHSCVPFFDQNLQSILVNCTRSLVTSTSKFETKYAAYEYTCTFYWVFETFVGCGCTPVTVSNYIDVWLTMVLEISGYLYFAFMFGYVASSRSTQAHALLEHSEKTKDLANFLYQENVDPVLATSTLKYFEYVWKRTNGSNPQEICRGLNTALMEDTLVFMYEKALREVPLFEKVERSFIRVITQHLHEMYFLKGETVIKYKDIQPYIYIIYKGKVDVMSSYNEMITCMGPGGMFGNFTGQSVSSSDVSICSNRSLDVLVIPSQTFFNLIKYYPKIQEPLNKAFEVSKDYILPMTTDIVDDTSSDMSEFEVHSMESGFDSRSGSSRLDIKMGILPSNASYSEVSQALSSFSLLSYQSYISFVNLFTPGSWMYQVFGYLTCLISTFNYVLCLYELTTLNNCFILFWVQASFDVYFYVKICFSMHEGYISKHGELILNSVKCRKRYFNHKGWFWSDVIANFPLELFGYCCTHPILTMHYLRVNKLLRLKYLIEFYKKTAAELTNNVTCLQVMMTFMVVIILIFSFTALWLLTLIAISPICIMRTLKLHLIDEEAPQRYWNYISSIYVVVAELTMTGGDEFVVDEVVCMVILAICLVCGKMLASTVVATSIQVAYTTKYASNAYEMAIVELNDMLKNQGLSNYQNMKFWKYVRELWVTERGRQLPALLGQTPYVRRCDLMSAMFGHHLRNCFLFADSPEPFLRQLAEALDYTVFLPGNYIVVAGDCDARMFWVASGHVSVVSVRPDLTETTHETLSTGDVFGLLQGINRGVSHCFSYRAESKATILTLSLDSLTNILSFFPETRQAIIDKTDILFAQL